MKAVYYAVTFVASLLVIAFVSWNVYIQWPVIETTIRNALPAQVAPEGRKCGCGPNCPRGGSCEDCKCPQNKLKQKACCPDH